MTKTICDICGKDMPSDLNLGFAKDHKFCISSYGEILDICTECRDELFKCIKKRKENKEVEK